jgi:glycosyltransferase involved in cell wall biosynthesis
MRIGIDYTPGVTLGAGIGRYTRGLVQALSELDHDNEYVLFAAPGFHSSPHLRVPASPRLHYRPIPASPRLMAILWHRLHIPLPIEAFVGPVDVFHSPDFVLPPQRRGARILTVHDLTFMRYPEGATPNLRRYLNAVVPRSVKRADLVLADSESTKRDLAELLDVPPEKVRVVYAGVEPRFQPIVDEEQLRVVARRYDLDPPFILTVGTLEPRKNLQRLFAAYALLRERLAGAPRLVVVGAKGWLTEGIFAALEESGIKEHVQFPGYVADEDLPAVYNLAGLFVFPSLYEGFGIPPLEALACGVPVACSNAPSLPEVVGDAALTFEPTDVEAMADAMLRLLTDSDLRAGLISRGRDRATHFTWAAAATDLLAAYREVTW